MFRVDYSPFGFAVLPLSPKEKRQGSERDPSRGLQAWSRLLEATGGNGGWQRPALLLKMCVRARACSLAGC